MLFGTFPYEEQWRGMAAIAIILMLAAVSALRVLSAKALALSWVAAMVIVFVLMLGGVFGLAPVPTHRWGGLPLTLIMFVGTVIGGIPAGVLLALGRRSQMPAIKALCIGFIEIVRGLPLVTVLFMASLMIPLFLPEGLTIDKFLRAQLAVCVEQTCNRGGGTVWPLATLRAIAETAQANGLRLHMDGARLLNACVASGVPASRYAEPCDSVWLDLSKGLGCPVGAVLAGSRHFIEEANRWKHRMGGAMRQAGILAAAGLYALEHHVDRLAHDHANARKFAAAIAGLPGIRLLFDDTPTNLVFFDISTSGLNTRELSQTLMKKGVRIGVESPHVMRAVFHLDIDEQGTDLAIDTLRLALPAEAGGIRQCS